MPDRWFVVSVESPSDEAIPALAEGLVASGAGGVEEDGRTLRAWLEPPADPVRYAHGLAARLAGAAGQPVSLHWEWRDERDWQAEWRRGLGPRRIGDRIVVAPSWSDPQAGPGDVVLVIDPGSAFGTGEHASTRGCLRLMEQAVPPGAHVLDIGTGSAVLAIAAAKLGARHVDAIEADPDSIGAAAENIERNRVADRVALSVEVATPATLDARPAAACDLITANLLSAVIAPLLPSLARLLAPGGALVIAGILRSEAAAMGAAVGRAGLLLDAVDEEDTWWSARARRSAAAAPEGAP